MNVGAKLGLYGLLLVAVLGASAAVGAAVGPVDTKSTAAHPGHQSADEDDRSGALPAGGLLVSQDGYTFDPEERQLGRGTFAFTIDGPDGQPVTAYDELHDKELHLIVASRDLRQYAHLHPVRDDAGR